MKTLFTAPYLLIYLHEGACPALELSWQGYVPSTTFREAALRSLALGTQYRVRGWLTDDRQLGALRPRDLDWVAVAGLQALNQLSLERFAQLESQDVLNRRTIAGMYQQVTPLLTYEVRCFDDLAPARAWVRGE